MKKKIIIVIIFAVFIIIGVLAYVNINGSLTAKSCLVRICYLYEENYRSVEENKEMYEKDDDALTQKIRKNNIFPSDNIRDYVSVGVFIELKNNSIFDATEITGFLVLDDDDSIIISKGGSIVVEELSGRDQDSIYMMHLFIYKGDKTDEDIVDYIHNLDIEIYYKNKFMSHLSETIHMSDIPIELDVIDWDEQKGAGTENNE